jgi:hypothetical protein
MALGMASEETWVSSGQSDLFRRPRFSLAFRARWLRGPGGRESEGKVEVRDYDPHFESFGLSILRDMAQVRHDHRKFTETRPVPHELTDLVQFPKHICGVVIDGWRNLALVAETPEIGMVRAAAQKDWAVARYTDHETILEALKQNQENQTPILPREIGLPRIRRLAQNRGLVTRGVDPRDVLRLSEDQFAELRQQASDELLKRVRLYRTSIKNNNGVEANSFVLPWADVMEVGETGDRFVKDFVSRFDPNNSRSRQRKRPADLRVAWRPPADGCTRFVIADGVVPVASALLSDDEVPAQKLFIVDGDAGVLALFQSHCFGVWAQATLSRSTSWMSRFSVSGTFETFPVVRPFELRKQPDGTSSLVLRPGDKRLYRLSNEWLNYTTSKDSTGPIDEQSELHRLRRHLDEAVLDVYGLPPNASSLAILERLLITNSRS